MPQEAKAQGNAWDKADVGRVFGKVKVLSTGQRFMAHALSVVKALCLNRALTERPNLIMG